jgi:multiple sugar transport system permease protein
MAETTLKPIAYIQSDPQRRNGALVIGLGALLLVVGLILLNFISANPTAPFLLKNVTPLVPLVGIVLVGQGVVIARMKGQRATAWFMALPGMIVILVIVILPTLYTWGVSTIRWDAQVRDQSFIFLENYRTLLTTSRVLDALKNTAIVAVCAVALELILGVGLAALMTEQFRGRTFVISVIILPLMLAPVVVGQTWRMLWDPRFGAVNDLLSRLTGQTVELLWLGDPQLATIAIIITDVWQWAPFVFLVTLAGFLAVNVELYEAAAIDGASGWQTFLRITLPIVRPVLLVALLFRLVDALKIFDILYLLTKGGPGYATENYSLYLYEQGFQFFRLGYTAAGSVLFLIVVVMIATVLIRRIGEV